MIEINRFKKRITSTIVFFLTLNLFININTIQSEAYSNIIFKNITIEDGLAQATVEAIYQDSRGYLWFGTNDGLNRFNGYEFKTYRNEIGLENCIVNNYIVSMNEDKDENLWVGTIDGASKINLDTNKITNYKSPEELSNNDVTDILVTRSGEILLATLDGLNIYDKENDNFERIFYGEGLVDQEIYSLDEDDKGNVWVGSSKGITKINLKDGISIKYNNDIIGESIEDSISKILCDNEYIWIGTSNSGMYKLNTVNLELEKMNIDNKKLPDNSINALLKDKNGILWIGTNSGLIKYNIENDYYTLFSKKESDRYSLVDDEVCDIIQDKSGLIWVGTYAGVSMFEQENKIEYYKADPSARISLNENVIHGIYEDNEELLWIGSNNKGVNIFDRKNNIMYDFSDIVKEQNLSNNSINDIQGYGEKIFIATDNGLNIYDKNTKKLKIYTEEDGLNSKNIRDLMYDEEGFLWIGTQNGFNILNLNTDEMINLNFLFNKYSITDKYSGCIFKDSEGIYWLGTFLNGGLIKIDPKDNSVKNYKFQENSNSISNNSIRIITEDYKGNLWIGTSGGLNKLNKENEEFTNYTTIDGLPNNNIYGILIDDNNNLWMSTNRGLSKMDPEKETFQNLNVADGLQSNEFNGNSYRKLKSGELVFGGINGLNIFNPDEITQNSYIPKVKFDGFKINGKEVDTIENAKLKHNENTINIKFFFPDYKNIKNIQYYYSLEGSNNEWFTVNTNEIVLSNLKSGTYVFKIKARNSSGIFSEESSLKFTIKPPFWKSIEFISFYIIVALGIIIFIFKNKDKKMKILDEMVSKRTRELSEEMKKNTELLNRVITLEKRKNAYLVNISHDLRTPLNVLSSIKQLVNELNKSEDGIEKEKLNHYMDILGKNVDRLLALINDLIDSSKIEHGNYHIDVAPHDIVYIVEETALSLKDYVESKNIELIIDPDIEECIIECDSSEIERCIINLINNSVKFTNNGGKILVSIVELEKEVKISVSDNGIGIEEKYLDNIFDRFNQVKDTYSQVKGGSGLGLTITKLIVGLHNGEIFAESKVNKGSKFTIVLPKSQPRDKN